MSKCLKAIVGTISKQNQRCDILFHFESQDSYAEFTKVLKMEEMSFQVNYSGDYIMSIEVKGQKGW